MQPTYSQIQAARCSDSTSLRHSNFRWQEVETQDGAATKVDRKTVARLLQRGVQAGTLEVHAVELQPRSGTAARKYEIVTLPSGLSADAVNKVCQTLAHVAFDHGLLQNRHEDETALHCSCEDATWSGCPITRCKSSGQGRIRHSN